MTELNDPNYYNRRADQERVLAGRALDPAIAMIHREMADRYDVLAQEARAPRLRVPLAAPVRA